MIFLKKYKIIFIFLLLSFISYAQKVNVKSYGAKGDGRTLDTEAIQRALNKIYENNGGILYFPKGSYTTDLIVINPPKVISIEIQGDGKESIIIKNANDKLNIGVFFSEVNNIDLKFQNISIDGNYLNRNRKWKLVSNNTYDVEDETNGVLIWNANNVVFNQCTINNVHGSGIAVFSSNSLKVNNNNISNTSSRGILGHRIENMETSSNTISNTGVFTNTFFINSRKTSLSSSYMTLYGDGIESSARKFIALNNKIYNPGRIGISHDLAIDLKYLKSEAVVKSNYIEINNKIINNSNPPAGMWFEQSHDVNVSENKIVIKKSGSKIVTGIRFYDITGKVTCKNNTIDAQTYNLNLNEAIGIFEPLSATFDITDNKMIGKFTNAITVSYEKKNAYLYNLFIINNDIKGSSSTVKKALDVQVYSKQDMPKEINFSNNKINMIKENHFKIGYFGDYSKKVNNSKYKIQNNTYVK